MSDQTIKSLITKSKSRGFVTYDELNAVLPSDKVSPDKIEDTMEMLSEMGITVSDADEAGNKKKIDNTKKHICHNLNFRLFTFLEAIFYPLFLVSRYSN